MSLWFVFALMTATAMFAVLWPLARREGGLKSGSDVAVYKDQLDEIERDRSAGLIGGSEADAAKVEVSRRLLAAADVQAIKPAPIAKPVALWRRRVVAIIALVLLPLGGLALYLAIGSPFLPGQPLAARATDHQNQRIEDLLAQVETHLASHPDEAAGWEAIAPVYLRLGRFEDAIKARRNILRIRGESADRQADLGEALVGASDGTVTADAKTAFERAVALDAQSVKARYFLGLAAEQDGHPDAAATMWRAMLASAPADAPWTEFVRREVARVSGGPSPDDFSAAANMAPDQRLAIIRSMVDRLAARLQQDGSDVEEWLRLVRSYMVLGERDKARAAAGDARRALASDPDKLRKIDAFVKEMGLEG